MFSKTAAAKAMAKGSACALWHCGPSQHASFSCRPCVTHTTIRPYNSNFNKGHACCARRSDSLQRWMRLIWRKPQPTPGMKRWRRRPHIVMSNNCQPCDARRAECATNWMNHVLWFDDRPGFISIVAHACTNNWMTATKHKLNDLKPRDFSDDLLLGHLQVTSVGLVVVGIIRACR